MDGPSGFRDLKCYITSDLAFVAGKPIRSFWMRYFFEPGFKYIVWLRITRMFYLRRGKIIDKFLWLLSRLILKHYSYKYSFDISYKAQINPGLTIAHYGSIIVPSNSIIGNNCTLRPGVVFGKKLTSDAFGIRVGNNVNFGVGSKVIGRITIGDNVIVGANAVVTKDVPDDCVVAGIPAKVINKGNVL